MIPSGSYSLLSYAPPIVLSGSTCSILFSCFIYLSLYIVVSCFVATIKSDPVSLLRCLLYSHVHINLSTAATIRLLKCPCNCFFFPILRSRCCVSQDFFILMFLVVQSVSLTLYELHAYFDDSPLQSFLLKYCMHNTK